MRSSPGVSHRVVTHRPQLFPVHRAREAFQAGRGRKQIFSFIRSSPGCPQLSGVRQHPCPTCPQGHPQAGFRRPLTHLYPRAIVLPDTRPPGYNGSRSVRGRQSANPRITGGLVSPTRGNASSPARSAARMRPRAANGQQLLLLGLLARDPCVLPSHVRKLAARRPAHGPDPSRPACRRLGFRARNVAEHAWSPGPASRDALDCGRAGARHQAPGPLPARGRRRRRGLVGRSVVIHPNSAGWPSAFAATDRRRRRPPSSRYGPRGGDP
jgi:hypothetical protein